jgi:hypothetical protein
VRAGFRPAEEDLRIIEASRRDGEKACDVIRRALRRLDREAAEERARVGLYWPGTGLSAEAGAPASCADARPR